MRLAHQIAFASLNRHKLEEFRALLQMHPAARHLELLPIQELVRNAGGLAKVENAPTYLENALAKARLGNQGCHYPTLADDSGIEVLALEGRPGPRSHRYAVPKAGQSQDEANVQKLLEELKGKSERSARFVCSLALVIEGISITVTGTLEGTLTDAPRGLGGFGYDPIFVPKGASRTLAEHSADEKNRVSHRALALQALFAQVESHGITFAKP